MEYQGRPILDIPLLSSWHRHSDAIEQHEAKRFIFKALDSVVSEPGEKGEVKMGGGAGGLKDDFYASKMLPVSWQEIANNMGVLAWDVNQTMVKLGSWQHRGGDFPRTRCLQDVLQVTDGYS